MLTDFSLLGFSQQVWGNFMVINYTLIAHSRLIAYLYFIQCGFRTVASALNSLAAVTSEDIISTGLDIKINPEMGARYAKWMSLG